MEIRTRPMIAVELFGKTTISSEKIEEIVIKKGRAVGKSEYGGFLGYTKDFETTRDSKVELINTPPEFILKNKSK